MYVKRDWETCALEACLFAVGPSAPIVDFTLVSFVSLFDLTFNFLWNHSNPSSL